MLDTDRDLPLCGAVNKEGELTLYKNNKGIFYTHEIKTDARDKVIGQTIDVTEVQEVAQIMFMMGFSKETIKDETGYEVIGDKKHRHLSS